MSTQGTIKRYTLIIQKITSTVYPSFIELKDFLFDHGFEISQRTLQRDLEQIRNEFGIEIVYRRSRNGYGLADGEDFPSDTLLRFIEILETAELLSENLKDGKELLHFISFESEGNLKGIENLRLIIPAIRAKRNISLLHENFETGKKTKYILQPYLLKEYQNRWYVFGTVNGSAQFRTFGIDRLTEINVKKEKFKPLSKLDPRTFFKDIVGLYYSNDKTEEVVIRVNALQAKYMKALPLHHSQTVTMENNKETFFRLLIKPNFEFKQRMLMLAGQAAVVKPKWLAAEIRSQLKDALSQYKA